VRSAAASGLVVPSGDGWEIHNFAGFSVHVDLSAAAPTTFGESAARSLADRPRWMNCKWLYDEIGSQLYEHITEQPEYYLTRTEDAILQANRCELRELVGDVTVVELGSGSSIKTRHVLEAWLAEGPAHYVPIDISEAALKGACDALVASYPSALRVEGIVAAYERGLPLVGTTSPLMLMFLGSTIGNLSEDQLETFLDHVATALNPGDFFLLGFDLVKDTATLEAAYNDAAGYTERFMLNLFARMNRELGAEIPTETLEYVGVYNEELERVDMHVRFDEALDIRLPEVGAEFHIAAGEMIFLEISRKYHVQPMVDRICAHGFALERVFTDADELFAVSLLTRR